MKTAGYGLEVFAEAVSGSQGNVSKMNRHSSQSMSTLGGCPGWVGGLGTTTGRPTWPQLSHLTAFILFMVTPIRESASGINTRPIVLFPVVVRVAQVDLRWA